MIKGLFNSYAVYFYSMVYNAVMNYSLYSGVKSSFYNLRAMILQIICQLMGGAIVE